MVACRIFPGSLFPRLASHAEGRSISHGAAAPIAGSRANLLAGSKPGVVAAASQRLGCIFAYYSPSGLLLCLPTPFGARAGRPALARGAWDTA